MAKNRHNGAFVFGTLVGGAVGAVAALWKTPYSGAELRQKLGLPAELGSRDRGPRVTATTGTSQPARPLGARALEFIEQAAAPLVGVKLGQTANNSQPGATPTTTSASATTTASATNGRISDAEFIDYPAQQPVGSTQG